MTIASKKSLGLHIDQNLKWDRHTQSICKKIASALGEIKRIRHPVPFHVPIDLNNSLVQPPFVLALFGTTMVSVSI